MSTVLEDQTMQFKGAINKLIDLYYPDLKSVKIKVGVLMSAQDDHQPHLKHRGNSAYAFIGATSAIQRVLCGYKYDALLTIDAAIWKELTGMQRTALVDHELRHITLMRDAEGAAVYDHAGRPKLKMCDHDFEFGLFSSMAERYGEDSMERRVMRHMANNGGQLLFELDGITLERKPVSVFEDGAEQAELEQQEEPAEA